MSLAPLAFNNEDDLRNEYNLKIKYNLKNEYDLKNEGYLNKPSFCSGSCDEMHATKLQKKLHLKILNTSLKLFVKFSGNTLDTHPSNFLKTSLNLPKNNN